MTKGNINFISRIIGKPSDESGQEIPAGTKVQGTIMLPKRLSDYASTAPQDLQRFFTPPKNSGTTPDIPEHLKDKAKLSTYARPTAADAARKRFNMNNHSELTR